MEKSNQVVLSMEQFKLLLAEIRELKTKINNIEAKTDNIHRIFNRVDDEPKSKKLSLKQKRDKALKDEIEAERVEIIKQINKENKKAKAERIAMLSAKILSRGKTKIDRN